MNPSVHRLLALAGLACATGFSPAECPPEAIPYRPAADVGEATARIVELGGSVRWTSREKNALEVDFQFGGTSLTDAHLQYLSQLQNLEVLRLKNTTITDAGLAHLSGLAGLKRLDLDKTRVTDAGLKHLANLDALESLNLFGTQVGDAGLSIVHELPMLKSLYLGETKVSTSGLAGLKRAHPDLDLTPDPARDRQRAQAAWEAARFAVANAEAALVLAEKNFKELSPKKEEFKKVSEAARQKQNELNKARDEASQQAAAAKRSLDEISKMVAELKNASEEAERKAAEAGSRYQELAAQLEEARKRAEEAATAARDAAKRFEAANLSKRFLDEAPGVRDRARAQEEDARKVLEALSTETIEAEKGP